MLTRSRDEWIAQYATFPPVVLGDGGRIYDEAQSNMALFRSRDIVQEGDHLLDFGCGVGKYAIPLTQMPITYTGVDISPDCIRFCQNVFQPWPQLSFRQIDVQNSLYHPAGKAAAEELSLPFEDETFDSAMALSVFTHAERLTAAERCIGEIRRVLKPGGRFLCTWFRSPPNTPTDDAQRTVFREEDIRHVLREWTWEVDWGGNSTSYHDQWCVFVRK